MLVTEQRKQLKKNERSLFNRKLTEINHFKTRMQ